MDKKLTVIIMTNLSGIAELGEVTHNVAGLYNKDLTVVSTEQGNDKCR